MKKFSYRLFLSLTVLVSFGSAARAQRIPLPLPDSPDDVVICKENAIPVDGGMVDLHIARSKDGLFSLKAQVTNNRMGELFTYMIEAQNLKCLIDVKLFEGLGEDTIRLKKLYCVPTPGSQNDQLSSFKLTPYEGLFLGYLTRGRLDMAQVLGTKGLDCQVKNLKN